MVDELAAQLGLQPLAIGKAADTGPRDRADHSRALIRRGSFAFEPFEIEAPPVALSELELEDEDELMILSRKGVERGFIVRELKYHHVAQGTLAGRPFVVNFCVLCCSAVGFSPVVEGRTLHFGSSGMSNGVGIISDRETNSQWELMTGECFAGPLRGRVLELWPVMLTTVGAARSERSEVPVFVSGVDSVPAKMLHRSWPRALEEQMPMPGFMQPTMARAIDPRRPRMELGLGIVEGGRRIFVPLSEVPEEGMMRELIGGRLLLIRRGLDGLPRARWADRRDGTEPMQLLTRWYGFSFSYPGCEIRRREAEGFGRALALA